jgi:hypothetical protein
LPKRTVPRVLDALVRLLMVEEAELSHWSVEVPRAMSEFRYVPPLKVEVARVEVAKILSATMLPATERRAYGEVVPRPKLPLWVSKKCAWPEEEAKTTRGWDEEA